jgi:hypothetical protein
MQLRIGHAQPDDAPVIAQMAGELLREIMAATGTQAFGFHQEKTEARVKYWMMNGRYSVLLACDAAGSEPRHMRTDFGRMKPKWFIPVDLK